MTLSDYYDDIVKSACEAIKFEPCATIRRCFDYWIYDDRGIEGVIECDCERLETEVGGDYDEIFYVCRGLSVDLIKVSTYGFECSRSELNALYAHLEYELTKYLEDNFSD